MSAEYNKIVLNAMQKELNWNSPPTEESLLQKGYAIMISGRLCRSQIFYELTRFWK